MRRILLIFLAISTLGALILNQINRQDSELPVDEPGLPRCLIIGDSISLSYHSALKEHLRGRCNVHRPPVNCESSTLGKEQIAKWLGKDEGLASQWDVIAFNFGHWDEVSPKKKYQDNLAAIIEELRKSKAKLIWVTTCPVPEGRPPVREMVKGEATGRTYKSVQRYLNPWAEEVILRHSEISICDQWAFVHQNRNTIYAKWWKGTDIHFFEDEAAPLGIFLADHILKVLNSD